MDKHNTETWYSRLGNTLFDRHWILVIEYDKCNLITLSQLYYVFVRHVKLYERGTFWWGRGNGTWSQRWGEKERCSSCCSGLNLHRISIITLQVSTQCLVLPRSNSPTCDRSKPLSPTSNLQIKSIFATALC